MPNTRLIALALVIVCVVALGGCSKHDLGLEPRLSLTGGRAAASTDSVPHPTPPPHDTTFIEPVVFVGSDSIPAGSSGNSRWLLGNTSKKPFTMKWFLSGDPSWPGYPIEGSVKIPGRKTVPLSVLMPVPASATTGIYTLRMAVTAPTVDTSIVYGYVRVFGNEPPPPPPPPPAAVVFEGSDSTRAGGTANTSWGLTNESNHDFTMDWTLSIVSAWPGFPLHGSVALGPNQTQHIVVLVAVPDTAMAGVRTLQMQVTRPDSLPPQSTSGWIVIQP